MSAERAVGAVEKGCKVMSTPETEQTEGRDFLSLDVNRVPEGFTPRPQCSIKVILKPDAEFLKRCDRLLLSSKQMAEFLGISAIQVTWLVYSDRIPLPLKIGWGRCLRWSAYELREWVDASCPRRGKWIEIHGSSGWLRKR